MVLWSLAMLEWLAGRLPRAHELADAAYELTEQTQHQHGLIWTARVKALVEADLGLVDQARASAEEGVAFSQTISKAHTVFGLGSLGHLELALGNLEAAGDCLRALPGLLLAGGMLDPTLPVWADTIETLIALGELEQARSYLEPYEAHARRLGSPLAMEGVHRCRGLAAAAAGNVTEAIGEFERAVAEQPAPPWVFERGRTLLCLGSAHRRAKQKRAARTTLEQALAIFGELDAPLWAEKAQAELRRISGRRPATAELTETEERVAALASAGRSNKEIAAELHMSVHTVGAHLSRVYRKLGVRSRSELAGLQARTAVEETPPA
jgi:DNA-binding CsgD family transcriptional regulator